MLSLHRSQKGFSLVELIIVLSLLGIVLSLGFNLLFFGSQAYTRSASQQIVQSNVRFATNSIIELVKHSVSVEILNNKPNSFENPYHYIYLESNQLVISYLNADGDRLQRVLSEEINSIAFRDASAEEQMLGLTITGVENDQSYAIEQEIALFNFNLEQLNLSITDSTDTGNGTALKFINDVSLIPGDLTNSLELNRESDFELFPGETFEFVANMEVTWQTSNVNVITIDTNGLASAVGEVGQSATITATSTDNFNMLKSVTITIVGIMDYYITITDSTHIPVIGNLNILLNSEETVHAEISPELAEGHTILNVLWYTPNEDDQNYIAIENTEVNTTVNVQGIAVGEDANLTVRITITDNDGETFDLPEESLIVNVTSTIQYAQLNAIDVNMQHVTISPSFNPNTTVYTIQGSGGRTITFKAETGVTMSIKDNGGSWVDYNNIYSKNYNLSQPVDIYVRVSEQGKLDREYRITN